MLRRTYLRVLDEHLLVAGGLLTSLHTALQLLGDAPALALQTYGRDETLDLGRLRACLLALLVGERAADDVLAHIVLLGQVEEPADLVRTLRTEAASNTRVGEAGDVLLA